MTFTKDERVITRVAIKCNTDACVRGDNNNRISFGNIALVMGVHQRVRATQSVIPSGFSAHASRGHEINKKGLGAKRRAISQKKTNVPLK